jgi:hypothetical protein
VVDCTAQGYIGKFHWSVDDPSVASVQQAANSNTFFYVNGVTVGSTTLHLSYQTGASTGSGSVTIQVNPAPTT